jgi:hypothetical protein
MAQPDKPQVAPLSEWIGSVEADALDKIAPAAITTAENWGIIHVVGRAAKLYSWVNRLV